VTGVQTCALPICKGSKVILETAGADEAEAMDALLALIADYFGEGE
jgi:phosphocarrier protein HPr